VKQRPFLALWTLAVLATVAAFVLHLGLRGRTVDLGYKLGKARAEQARLREMKRVLSLEAASYETPQRVEMVARTLLGMNPPPPERVIPLKPIAPILPPEDADTDGDSDQPAAKPSASARASGAPSQGAPPSAPSDAPSAPVANAAPSASAAPSANDVPAAVMDPGAPVAPQGVGP
jgi:cell division protein FtsL